MDAALALGWLAMSMWWSIVDVPMFAVEFEIVVYDSFISLSFPLSPSALFIAPAIRYYSEFSVSSDVIVLCRGRALVCGVFLLIIWCVC